MAGQREKKLPALAAKAVDVRKAPRKLKGLGRHGDEHPVWRISLADFEHQRWGWQNAQPLEVGTVLRFLREMERLKWREIRAQLTGGDRRRGPKHKFIPMSSLCTEAQNALTDLKLDDANDVWFRFRLGNRQRLWGVIDGEVFYPVWWDPRHEVCPSIDQ